MHPSRSRDFYAMVDCNNFYVSCERVFNPALEGLPVVVLSNNDGCVISRSNEAKAIGIAMAEPAFKRKEFYARHGVRICSSNYTLYGDMSARVAQVMGRFSSEVERYSIDESFLLFRSMDRDRLFALGQNIRSTVLRWTGIPVCVGLARTKTLAKVANRLAKKTPTSDGVWLFDDLADIEARLAGLDVGDVWGIGRRYARFLKSRGIDTALKLARLPHHWVRSHLTITGLHTVLELQQIPCIPLEESPPPAKSLVCSRSFGTRLDDLESLEQALSANVLRVCEKLRARKLLAGAVFVFLETSRFFPDPQHNPSGSRELLYPTAYTPDILSAALGILRRIRRPGFRYQKAGVILTELVQEQRRQLSFLEPDPARQSRQASLMHAVDELNALYGRDTVKIAAAGTGGKKPWHMRQQSLSQRFTTSWNELPVVR